MSAMRRVKSIIPGALRLIQGNTLQARSRHVMSIRTDSRPFTITSARSLWCARKENILSVNQTHKCSCCSIHTEGDAELAEFLTEEIKLEKKHGSSKLPIIDGFELKSKNECDVTLAKIGSSEGVRISFNVNNAIEDESAYDDPEKESDPTQIRCKPPFVVEIDKQNGKTLHIQCQFASVGDMAEAGAQDVEDDMIEITDVTLLESGQEWKDKSFSLQGGMMDGNLYDMLLNMMEERGLDAKFISQLVEFSTAYEHEQYVQFLKDLKVFATSK